MSVRRIVLGLSIMTLVGARAARAQEPDQVGLTIGYPASVGVIWHVSDRFALRPEVSLSQSSGDATTGSVGSVFQVSSDSWQIGVGLSALFYVRQWDALRAYVSPRFSYARTQATSTTTSPVYATSLTDLTSSTYLVAGSFGGQYSLSRRFGLFGEVGLGYTKANSTSSGGTSFVSALPDIHQRFSMSVS